jgi:hypothetical protein
VREEVLLDPALRTLASLSEYDRSQVALIIQFLCNDSSGAEAVGQLMDDLSVNFFRYIEDQY